MLKSSHRFKKDKRKIDLEKFEEISAIRGKKPTTINQKLTTYNLQPNKYILGHYQIQPTYY